MADRTGPEFAAPQSLPALRPVRAGQPASPAAVRGGLATPERRQSVQRTSPLSFALRSDFYGFLFGVSGSALLAMRDDTLSPYGFALFLLSNLAWLTFSFRTKQRWLMLQTVAFTVTSTLGVYRWLFLH